MNRNYFYIVLAITLGSLLLILFSFWHKGDSSRVEREHIIPPPRSPYHSYISGVGVVEPISGNIVIGTSLSGVVEKVFVTVGDKVHKGDMLFQLESRELKADLRVKQMAYRSALAQLEKLEALPHPDDLISAEASLKNAQNAAEEGRLQYEMVLNLPDPRAISLEEKDRRKFKYQQAQEKLNEAKASYEKIKAGSWKPDLEIARFEVMHAKANVASIETDIQRTMIRSPIDGTVLQVKLHEGEYSSPGNGRSMIIGDTNELYLRVSINQLEVANFNSHAPAVGFLQGDSSLVFPLEFVRVEPFLLAKKDITNEISEKVDTRIFQIIYKIMKNDSHLFVGARMDVFIEREGSK